MAAKKPDKVEVGIAQLQLNPENFRLAPRPDGAVWTQPALLEYYATREDVQDLARDIALQGTNPSKRLIVEAALSKSNGRHKVLEGNRRVAALRLLREPALAGNAKGSTPVTRTLQLSPMMGQEECHAAEKAI